MSGGLRAPDGRSRPPLPKLKLEQLLWLKLGSEHAAAMAKQTPLSFVRNVGALTPVTADRHDAPSFADGQVAQSAFEASMGASAALRFVNTFQAQLRDRFGDHSPEALQSDAHKVAGMASLMGVAPLGEAARRLEDVCQVGEDHGPALSELRTALAGAQISLANWASRLADGLAQGA